MADTEWILKGRYRMGDVIGSGGMAMVYKATDVETGRVVAVKMLRSEYMQDVSYVYQFRKEAQICIEHHHRNIVDTLEIGEEDGRLFIVMEYVAGQTLKEYIAKYGRLNHAQIVDLGVEICDALHYAHCHKLVHRDIKPQNIMLTTNHVAKVADFGIARSTALSTITMGGDKVMGSVHYFSPEQARGGHTDAKSDIYSLGIVLYEMATGQLPFQGDTAVTVAIKQLQEKPVPPAKLNPSIPRSLEDIILKAMCKDPNCRYGSARELANDLMKSLRNPDGNFVKFIKPAMPNVAATVRMPKMRDGLLSSTGVHEPVSEGTGEHRAIQPKRKRWTVGTIIRIALLTLLLVAVAVGGAFLVNKLQIVRINSRVVPQVVGYSSNEAQLMIIDANLVCNLTEEFSADVPNGKVIRCSPMEGESVDVNSTVTLYISKGSEKAAVPNLTNMTQQEAQAELEAKGFALGDVRNSTNAAVQDGLVLQQDPAADSQQVLGSKVDIWISKNTQETVIMRDYVGKMEADAISLLARDGLSVGEITRVESQEAAGTVLEQNPVKDTTVHVGDAIQLWISKGLGPVNNVTTVEVTVNVTKASSAVRIVLWADGQSQDVVNETKTTGTYIYTVTPATDIQQEQTVIVYLDGVEIQRTELS